MIAGPELWLFEKVEDDGMNGRIRNTWVVDPVKGQAARDIYFKDGRFSAAFDGPFEEIDLDASA